MLARYALLLTFDELTKLSRNTQIELANLDPEFAKICGVPTQENPPEQPSNPRPTVQQGSTTVVMPARDQVNQQNSPAYNAAMSGGLPGMPGMPQAPPQMVAPVVPSAMPIHNGLPQAPQDQQTAVVNPMPQAQMPGMPQAPPPTTIPAMLSPTQQIQVPHQMMNVQGPPAATNTLTPQWVKTEFIPKDVMANYGGQFAVSLLEQAVQQQIIPRPHLDCVTDQNVAQFYQFANQLLGRAV